MSVNNCIVIELDVFLRDVVPTINNHIIKQAVEVKRCGMHTPCIQMSHGTITITINKACGMILLDTCHLEY